jgi:CubicO group peptidase (beta-lactamase class C family)
MKQLMRRNKALAYLLVFILVTAVSCSNADEMVSKDIDILLNEYVEAVNSLGGPAKISGCILIIREGELIASVTSGMADYEKGTPFELSTATLLCSTTKLFTAIAIMQLNEKGLLDLDDRITMYYPDQIDGDNITIHHLLSHTAGILRDVTDEKLIDPYANTDKDDLIRLINQSALRFKPGERMAYSNAGYQLLAGIIETVSGLSYDEYLRHHIFSPADMKNSGSASSSSVPNLALGHMFNGLRFVKLKPFDLSHAFGSGNIYTTALDMIHFEDALSNGLLISKESLDIMIHDRTGLNRYYGYGCYVGEFRGHSWFGHPGNFSSGYHSNFIRYPDEDLSIIILLNNSWSDNNTLANTISAIAMGDLIRLPSRKTAIRLTDEELDQFSGKYKLSESVNIAIENHNGTLTVKLPDETIQLTPYDQTAFFDTRHELWEHFFEFDSSGKLNYYVMRNCTEEYRMEKIR